MLYNTFTKVSVLYNYVILLVKRGNVIAANIWNEYAVTIGLNVSKGCQQQIGKGNGNANIGGDGNTDFNIGHTKSFHPLSWINEGIRFFNSSGVNVLAIKVSNVGQFNSCAIAQNCTIAFSFIIIISDYTVNIVRQSRKRLPKILTLLTFSQFTD